MNVLLRTLADGLIHLAETQPQRSMAAHHLREAAAELLDAECALERESPSQGGLPHE